jgi:hypothetical protein
MSLREKITISVQLQNYIGATPTKPCRRKITAPQHTTTHTVVTQAHTKKKKITTSDPKHSKVKQIPLQITTKRLYTPPQR